MARAVTRVGRVAGHQASSPLLSGFPADWFCLFRGTTALTTPGGRPLARAQRELLDAIAAEADTRAGLRLESLSMYSMYCTLKDMIEPQRQREDKGTSRGLLLSDPSLRRCAGPEAAEQTARLGPLEAYFERNGLPMLSLSQAGDAEHQEELLRHLGLEAQMNHLVEFFDRQMREMTPAQHCVVTNCVHAHDVFALGVLLAQSACTAGEYAEGLLAVHCRIPGVFGDVTERQARRAKMDALADAELMLRFRDLASA